MAEWRSSNLTSSSFAVHVEGCLAASFKFFRFISFLNLWIFECFLFILKQLKIHRHSGEIFRELADKSWVRKIKIFRRRIKLFSVNRWHGSPKCPNVHFLLRFLEFSFSGWFPVFICVFMCLTFLCILCFLIFSSFSGIFLKFLHFLLFFGGINFSSLDNREKVRNNWKIFTSSLISVISTIFLLYIQN